MDVVTFGETMIAMNPLAVGDLADVSRFEKRMAGSESNVAIGLARLGHQVTWVSRLGEDGFGRFVRNSLSAEGVDVSFVTMDAAAPTGVYFKSVSETGKASVMYYRKHSAASRMTKQHMPEDLLASARYLFVSGITPALSASCLELVHHALATARAHGVKIVFDPNIRLQLWSETEARPVLLDIAAQSDIVLPGVEEGRILTGHTDERMIAEHLLRGRTNTVVVKLGRAGAYVKSGQPEQYVSGFSVRQVDEIGAGDAFAAGFLSGLLDNLTLYEAARRACALGALAVTRKGDYEALPNRDVLRTFMESGVVPEIMQTEGSL